MLLANDGPSILKVCNSPDYHDRAPQQALDAATFEKFWPRKIMILFGKPGVCFSVRFVQLDPLSA